jgi:hypothetical protein
MIRLKSSSRLRFEIINKEMAAIAQGGLKKLKNIFKPYLYDDIPGAIFGIVESKVHVERSLIATGMFILSLFLYNSICLGLLTIFSIYLTFGWGNDTLCNLIGLVYPIYAS